MFGRVAIGVTALLLVLTGCSTHHPEPPSESWTAFRCDQWGGRPPEPCGRPEKVEHHDVSYRVTGTTAGTVAISLLAPGRESIESADHALPWSTTWNLDWSTSPQLTLIATAPRSPGTGTLTCEILIDAEVVATETATDGDDEAVCQIPAG